MCRVAQVCGLLRDGVGASAARRRHSRGRTRTHQHLFLLPHEFCTPTLPSSAVHHHWGKTETDKPDSRPTPPHSHCGVCTGRLAGLGVLRRARGLAGCACASTGLSRRVDGSVELSTSPVPSLSSRLRFESASLVREKGSERCPATCRCVRHHRGNPVR